MSNTSRAFALASVTLAALATGRAEAADLWNTDAPSLLRTETISAEVSAGYLTGQAKEYVYDTSTAGRPKLSQLTWNIGNTAAAGGRLTLRPLDWLTIRARGWSTIAASDGVMRDYDWLFGYYGFDSYSHYSVSPDTVTVTGWQGDISAAATYYQEDDLALSVIGGYRHLTMKWNAKGGRYMYSVNGFRDTVGTLPSGTIGVAYQQWWDTPYLGLGVSYSTDDWSFTGEAIGSPLVMGRAKDHHNLRDLVIKDDFSFSSMYGLAFGAEYRILPGVSLTGRAEYQKYMTARGDGTYFDGGTGTVMSYPKGAGAESDNVLLSLGVKGRI